ncbi:MAG: hypothetical protein WCD86_02855 [Ktedonobacteraceae bacterium]
MINPSILAIFVLVFVGLGVYNIYTGQKRIRAARAQGQHLPWYKQINFLTGVEYVLLSLVFLISLDFKALPKGLQSVVIPFYFVVLALSAVLAVMVIWRGISNARRRPAPNTPAQSNPKRNGTVKEVDTTSYLTPEERAARIERRRKRRQNAVAARRRKAGKVG